MAPVGVYHCVWVIMALHLYFLINQRKGKLVAALSYQISVNDALNLLFQLILMTEKFFFASYGHTYFNFLTQFKRVFFTFLITTLLQEFTTGQFDFHSFAIIQILTGLSMKKMIHLDHLD